MATQSVPATCIALVIQTENCTNQEHPDPCSTTAEYIMYMYVFSVISYSGIVLNVLNLVIFTRPGFRMNKTTLTFLTALAFFDLGYLATAAGIAIVRCVPPRQTWQLYFGSYFEVYIYLPICNSLASASIFLTVVISAERFMSIRQISWMKTTNRVRWKAVALVISCLVGGFAMNMSYFFYKEVDENGEMVYTEYGQSEGFVRYSWARLILNKIVPIAIIIIFNTLLVVAVVRSQRQAKSTSDVSSNVSVRRRRQQTRLTVMMISISFMLAVCHSFEPFAHSGLYRTIFGQCSTHTTQYQLVRVVANTLEALSFASNFIFYCVFNGEFSKRLRLLLCCCLYKRTAPSFPEADPGETSVNVIANAKILEDT
ncbi:hypothetical protein LSH36_58g22034 [Paralvinella palmiformis]|uniref:G-protein coupled receptors family 1 profile domain-containing protein n=1 Tax=Paralvinella palmiformis TaxID=53620 RepID=A0AAD9K4N3_9ANNE|nr:hypothetical protein LSH36_58g22034 [Paralvinella palmiformis]